jgi:signal transduction histidine kinase
VTTPPCAWRHGPRRRPPWWPADEPWPPPGPPWARWRAGRGHFAWRFAILLCVLFVFAVGVATVFLSLAAIALRLVKVPAALGAVWWTASALVLLLVLGLVLVARALRRLASPVVDVMDAASRLAAGDYAVRVIERGPPATRRLARAFNDMAARLQAHEASRRSLLADIAHELQTPLAVVQGNVEGLLDGVYPRDDSHLSAVLEETRILSALIDDLRTLALAETGTLALHRETVDLGVLLHDVVTAFQPKAEAAGVAITADCPPEVPAVDIDPVRIRQVVTNLVTNALRHTTAGGAIRLTCQRGTDTTSSREVSVSVIDSGSGIAAADLPHVFSRFYKSVDSPGSGLGLAIAQQLIALHGGRIRAESELGKGTTVHFTLPLDAE